MIFSQRIIAPSHSSRRFGKLWPSRLECPIQDRSVGNAASVNCLLALRIVVSSMFNCLHTSFIDAADKAVSPTAARTVDNDAPPAE